MSAVVTDTKITMLSIISHILALPFISAERRKHKYYVSIRETISETEFPFDISFSYTKMNPVTCINAIENLSTIKTMMYHHDIYIQSVSNGNKI